jgi:hypothetical protein
MGGRRSSDKAELEDDRVWAGSASPGLAARAGYRQNPIACYGGCGWAFAVLSDSGETAMMAFRRALPRERLEGLRRDGRLNTFKRPSSARSASACARSRVTFSSVTRSFSIGRRDRRRRFRSRRRGLELGVGFGRPFAQRGDVRGPAFGALLAAIFT